MPGLGGAIAPQGPNITALVIAAVFVVLVVVGAMCALYLSRRGKNE